jgi:Xaa-Pro dipeptidase
MSRRPDGDALMTPAFDGLEYDRRVAAVRASMADANLRALLLFSQESLYYLFGYDQIGYWVYQCVVLTPEGTPIAIARAADAPMIRATGRLEARIWLDDPNRDPIEMTHEALSEAGVIGADAQVGIELRSHALLASYHEALRQELGRAVQLVDASELVAAHRMVKSPAEVALVRRAGEIMDRAFLAARDILKPGIRETDLHAAIAQVLYANGADPPAVPPPIASGPRTQTQTHGSATERRIEAGDPVTIEVGAPYRRYHAVGLRSALVGASSPAIQRLHDGLSGALATGEQLIGPGVPTAVVARATLAGLEDAGLSRAGRHVGYGIGIGYPPTWLEPMRIKLTDPNVLVPGMTFFFFVGAPTEDERFYIAVGDPVLVTDSGFELLTTLPRELWIA